jgi:hypothetical protein
MSSYLPGTDPSTMTTAGAPSGFNFGSLLQQLLKNRGISGSLSQPSEQPRNDFGGGLAVEPPRSDDGSGGLPTPQPRIPLRGFGGSGISQIDAGSFPDPRRPFRGYQPRGFGGFGGYGGMGMNPMMGMGLGGMFGGGMGQMGGFYGGGFGGGFMPRNNPYSFGGLGGFGGFGGGYSPMYGGMGGFGMNPYQSQYNRPQFQNQLTSMNQNQGMMNQGLGQPQPQVMQAQQAMPQQQAQPQTLNNQYQRAFY